MLHACDQIFDLTKNLEKNFWTKQGLDYIGEKNLLVGKIIYKFL